MITYINVIQVEYPSNKSTTWKFSKVKDAWNFLKSLKSLKSPGYYVLCFEMK